MSTWAWTRGAGGGGGGEESSCVVCSDWACRGPGESGRGGRLHPRAARAGRRPPPRSTPDSPPRTVYCGSGGVLPNGAKRSPELWTLTQSGHPHAGCPLIRCHHSPGTGSRQRLGGYAMGIPGAPPIPRLLVPPSPPSDGWRPTARSYVSSPGGPGGPVVEQRIAFRPRVRIGRSCSTGRVRVIAAEGPTPETPLVDVWFGGGGIRNSRRSGRTPAWSIWISAGTRPLEVTRWSRCAPLMIGDAGAA